MQKNLRELQISAGAAPAFARLISVVNLSKAAIIVVCAVTAYSGANLVIASKEAEWIGDAISGVSGNEPKPLSSADKSFLANWKSVTGVADLVRWLSRAAVRAEEPEDKAAIEAAVTGMVENSPATDSLWQDLAEARKAKGAPAERVFAAFRMSHLTGSHEGHTMVRRALFGLGLWASLTDNDRSTVVQDMAATIDPSFDAKDRYREALLAMPEAVRANVLASLAASGLKTPEILRALGQ